MDLKATTSANLLQMSGLIPQTNTRDRSFWLRFPSLLEHATPNLV